MTEAHCSHSDARSVGLYASPHRCHRRILESNKMGLGKGNEQKFAWMRARMAKCRRGKYRKNTRTSSLPDKAIHGRVACYNTGCRCDACRAANREASAKWRKNHPDYYREWRKNHPASGCLELPLEQRCSLIEDSIERLKRVVPLGIILREVKLHSRA